MNRALDLLDLLAQECDRLADFLAEFVAIGCQPVSGVPQVVAHTDEFGDHSVRGAALRCLAAGFEFVDSLTQSVLQIRAGLYECGVQHGAFEPEDLRRLRAIDRRLGEIDAVCRVGLWANALATDPAWDDIRALARHFLLTALGDWRQPLPRPVRP
ncbi:hypothetical protein [Streptomyces sp. NPDC092370]|uniref:hypothetical protein n=1 Tax=Streptomyces sp. NPDC092370 TaxID=3366016 RepID=UPI0037F73DE2